MIMRRYGISRSTVAVTGIVLVLLLAAGLYYATNIGRQPNIQSSTGRFTLSTPVVLSAGGSTFVNPVMQVWASAYRNVTNGMVSVNYQAIGSGAGQQGIFSGTFDFAGSDAPVKASQLANFTGKTLLQIPETLGAVAIFYNIPGLTTSLRFTGTVLAQIFMQQITKWNDPAIASLNPGVSLPDQTIIVVHRADGSGTTFAFTTYLAKVYPDWASKVGVGTSVKWPAGELGGKGSSGVAGVVSQNPYSIGYADYFYAVENNLAVAQIQNAAGNWVTPSLASITAAASDFASQIQQNATISIANAPGANSYPISTFTWLLVWKDQTDPAKAYAIAHFFWWIVTDGQKYGPPRYYPTLPQNVVQIDEGLIAQINVNGQTFVP